MNRTQLPRCLKIIPHGLAAVVAAACVSPSPDGAAGSDKTRGAGGSESGLTAVTGSAGDRALLLGVGEHKQARYNLPGIDKDVQMVADSAERMGFDRKNIKVLMDTKVTADAIRSAFKTFLSKAGPEDRVLVYFSGHGTYVPDNNNDESDGRDEALLMSDAPAPFDGRSGILLDDEVDQLFKALPSKRKMFFVDACHSGTMHKGVLSPKAFGPGGIEGIAKYVEVEDPKVKAFAPVLRPQGSTNSGVVETEPTTPVPAVAPPPPGTPPPPAPVPSSPIMAMTAAADHEQSIATDAGSVFTLGLYDAIARAVRNNRRLTMQQLYDEVSAAVRRRLAGGGVGDFHPQIAGNVATPLWGQVERPAGERGPTWRRAEGMLDKAKAMTMTANKPKYKVGDKLVLTMDIPVDGYLNILNVGPDDQAIVLFPNTFDQNNKVKRGKFAFPTTAMNFDIQAQPPAGDALVVAVVSSTPRNFLNESLDKRKGAGDNYATEEAFPTAAYRSFAPVAKGQLYGASVVLNVSP